MRSTHADNRRLPPGSIMAFVYCTTVAYGIVLGPKTIVAFAREAAPVVTALALGVSVLIQYVFVKMAERFPHLTLFQWPVRMFGFLGYIPVLFIIVYFVVMLTAHVYQFSTLLHLMFLPRTPNAVIVVFGFILSLYAASLGVETMSRAFQLIMYVEILALVPLLLVGPKAFTWTYLLPALPMDTRVWALGPFIAMAGFLGFGHTPLTLLPQVQPGGKILRPALLGLLLAGIVIWGFTVSVLGVFGPDVTGLLGFPTFEYSQVIELPQALSFVSRYSLFFGTIWILAVTKLATIELYIISLGIKQVFGLRHYRTALPWVGLVAATAASLIPNPAIGEQMVTTISKVGISLAAVFVPGLGLLVALMRRRADKVAKDSQAASGANGN